jgi:hypothetical protein
MKKILCLMIIFYLPVGFYSIDLKNIDSLHDNGNYQDAYKQLTGAFNKSVPDASIIWRITRELYEYTGNIKDKKDKIAKLDEGLDFLKPYYDLKSGEIRDRATIIYWYAVFSSEKARTKGIKESLDNIPNLFKFCNDAIAIDPGYGDPYYLKAMIDDGLPTMFGGDKFNMSVNLTKALKCDPENYWYLVDGAKAYKNRNWDSDKKKKMAGKKGMDDGSPQNLDDKEFAKTLLNKAVELYNAAAVKSKINQGKIEEAKKMLEKM